MAWIVGAGIAAGLAASAYGANKQSKAIDSANATNKEISKETNALNWAMKMYDKGVGQDGRAVNTKLPVWATVDIDSKGNILRATPIDPNKTYDNSLPQTVSQEQAPSWTSNSAAMQYLNGGKS